MEPTLSRPRQPSLVRPYLTLALAVASELTGTTALKYADGFSNPLPSAVVVATYLAAFYLLSATLQELPVGLVYATWAAAGIVGAAVIGAVAFDEPVDAAGLVGIGLIVAGVAVLNLLSETYAPVH